LLPLSYTGLYQLIHIQIQVIAEIDQNHIEILVGIKRASEHKEAGFQITFESTFDSHVKYIISFSRKFTRELKADVNEKSCV